MYQESYDTENGCLTLRINWQSVSGPLVAERRREKEFLRGLILGTANIGPGCPEAEGCSATEDHWQKRTPEYVGGALRRYAEVAALE